MMKRDMQDETVRRMGRFDQLRTHHNQQRAAQIARRATFQLRDKAVRGVLADLEDVLSEKLKSKPVRPVRHFSVEGWADDMSWRLVERQEERDGPPVVTTLYFTVEVVSTADGHPRFKINTGDVDDDLDFHLRTLGIEPGASLICEPTEDDLRRTFLEMLS
jgi:hypothetical protein